MRIWVDPTKRAWRRYHGGSYGEVMVGYDESGTIFYATGNEFCEKLGWERAENVVIEDSRRFEHVCADLVASGACEGTRRGDFTGMCRPRAKAVRKVAQKAPKRARTRSREQSSTPKAQTALNLDQDEPLVKVSSAKGPEKACERVPKAVSGHDFTPKVPKVRPSAHKTRKRAPESLSGAQRGTRRSCIHKDGRNRRSSFAAINAYWSKVAATSLSV